MNAPFTFRVLLHLTCFVCVALTGHVHGAPADANARLIARMNEIRFTDPLKPVGDTVQKQILSIFDQISDHYRAQWKELFPLVMELDAVRRIATASDWVNLMSLPFHDAPLEETLRSWCMLLDLHFEVEKGLVVVSTAAAPRENVPPDFLPMKRDM